MKEALYYERNEGKTVTCRLCPHRCRIAVGRRGLCGVRENRAGVLFSMNYGRVSSIALDPVEKKPLYHFHPGEFILSVGSVGCNLSCLFCQNWSISKEVETPTQAMSADKIIAQAKRLGSFGIAYTYNEPFISYEFVLETAARTKEAGLKNVLVTNGYVAQEPLEEILPYIDAMNIDLKSIRDEFYRKVCGGRVAEVQRTIEAAAPRCHVELTNLIIPTLNDSEEDLRDLVDWVCDKAGAHVPLHFSRYFPCYKMTLPPTPRETLQKAQDIAKKRLKYVYVGNAW
jgi:pyruvate formate lyase activating enzyme